MRCEPGIFKLAPESVIKPWGLIHGAALEFTSIRVGIGEFWLASAQTGRGNYSNRIVAPALDVTLAELLQEADRQGDEALEGLIGAHALGKLKANPHRGKTEAWHVRAAEGRAGLLSGPGTPEQLDELKRLVQSHALGPDVASWSEEARDVLGLIEPLAEGQIFLVPCGTLHSMYAIGEGSRLIVDELQQGYGESLLPTLSKILMVEDSLESMQVHPCDATVAAAVLGEIEVDQDLQVTPTVRISDFGRGRTENPELGFRLTDVSAGIRTVPAVEVRPSEAVIVRILVADSHLMKSRIRVSAGAAWSAAGGFPVYGCYHVLHCLRGAAKLSADGHSAELVAGQTAFVCGALEQQLVIDAPEGCELFDDTVPQLSVLRKFLDENGASAGEIEALLNPPRAV